jgi:hypothetical protein
MLDHLRVLSYGLTNLKKQPGLDKFGLHVIRYDSDRKLWN